CGNCCCRNCCCGSGHGRDASAGKPSRPWPLPQGYPECPGVAATPAQEAMMFSRPKSTRYAAFAAALLLSTSAFAAPPPDLDARVEAAMQAYATPGFAIAIVEDGEVVHAKGYGVRKLGSPEKVDADTIFPTGSTGKAVTTAAIAILVDEGRMDWDDKVIDHLPDFRMHDPWVTREMTVRDLLVHRSGL